jgi:hypothetical protein
MGVAPHVQELRDLLGPQALLLSWPKGTKGGKRKWGDLTIRSMDEPRYLVRLGEGNIGVALGEKSAGLCSLDIDSDVELSEFLELNGEIAHTLRSRGRRGGNLWWQLTPPYPRLTSLKRDGKAWGEWRSTGGQTIIYGTHPTGPEYRIVNRVKPLAIQFNEIKWPEGILPLLMTQPIESATESTELTEITEKTEPTELPEPTERTEANRSGIFAPGCLVIANFEEAVALSLPTGPHDNHHQLFKLARAIKSLELTRGTPVTKPELKGALSMWYAQAAPHLRANLSRDDYYFELLEAFEHAKVPLGADVLGAAWGRAKMKEPPAEANQFETLEVQTLVSLCRELQLMCGASPFFLSCRSLQALLGHETHATAAKWLNGLCRAGILTVADKGGPKTQRATRFWYLPLHPNHASNL